MEYHFVVAWSEENGWYIDWATLDSKFNERTVWVPNLDEWVHVSNKSELGRKEAELSNKLFEALAQLSNN